MGGAHKCRLQLPWACSGKVDPLRHKVLLLPMRPVKPQGAAPAFRLSVTHRPLCSYLSTSVLEGEVLVFLGGLSEQTGTFISFV